MISRFERYKLTLDAWISLMPDSRPERYIRKLLRFIPFANPKAFYIGRVKQEIKRHIQENIPPLPKERAITASDFGDFHLQSPSPKSRDIELDSIESLQFVFISIDIENMRGTIESIDRYIDFVDSYIIVTRADMIDEFQTLISKYPISIIDEDSILDGVDNFKKMDHQTKNWILRASLLKLDILQEQFIMLDDDNRPIRDITINHFIKDNKFIAYYYYDLTRWRHYYSDYDKGQHNSMDLLRYERFDLYSYSSHKPQIIDRAIFKEVVDRYYDIAIKMPIDEWSIYFNYATALYPDLFENKKFDVLNWPSNPSDWEWVYTPDSYHFENYYPLLYRDGIFTLDITLSVDEKIAIKQNQLEPYLKTQKSIKDGIDKIITISKKYRLTYSEISFKFTNKELIIYDFLYYVEAKSKFWLHMPLKFQSIDIDRRDKVQLTYYLNGDFWYSNLVDNHLSNSTIYLSIDATKLKAQPYMIQIDISINGDKCYGVLSPFVMKLNLH